MYEQLQNSGEIDEREKIALQIARYLRQGVEADHIFDLIKHYNCASSLVSSEAEILYIAELNYKASFRIAPALKTLALTYLEQSLNILSRLTSVSEESLELTFLVQYAASKLCIQCGLIEKAEDIISKMKQSALTDMRLSKCTALMITLRIAQNKASEAIYIGDSARCSIHACLKELGFFNKEGAEIMMNLEEKFKGKSIENILTKERNIDELVSIVDEMVQSCALLSHKRRDHRLIALFNIMVKLFNKGCSIALNHGFLETDVLSFSSILPMFLGRDFGYYDFERAKFVGELVLTAHPSVNAESKVISFLGLVSGFQYFGTYFETNERVNQAVTLALEEKLTLLAFVTLLTFNVSCFLPFGKSIAALKDYDRKFHEYKDFNESQVSQWVKVMDLYDCLAKGTAFVVDFDPEWTAWILPFVQYLGLLDAMIYFRETRRDLYAKLEADTKALHGSWQYVDFLLFGVILDCEVTKEPQNKEEILKRIDEKIQVLKCHMQEQRTTEQKFKLSLALAERVYCA